MSTPPTRTYTVIKTFIDRKCRLATGHTGIHGGDEKEAMYVFNAHVRAAGTTHPRMTGVTLIDAAGNVIAEWSREARVVA